MADRLSALDASFLYLEESTTPMHVGSVMVFEPGPDGLAYDLVRDHLQARIALVPRYRQRIRTVPGGLGTPVWVDDERFDITYHVRRSALPSPGDREQLEDLVARLQARRLDRSRPLWEVFVVEGLEHGRVALITKVHQALVDGVHAVDLAQVVLDESPEVQQAPPQTWYPSGEPSDVELVVSAIADTVRRPQRLLDTMSSSAGDLRATASKAFSMAGRLASAVQVFSKPTPRSPLNRDISRQRRFLTISTDLAQYREVRNHANAASARINEGPARTSGPTTVNDVVLASLAGALRSWLQTRGESVAPGDVIRALVPMSVHVADPREAGALGSRVASLLVDLPTGEASPLMRLHQVAYQTKEHRETGYAVDAPGIAGIAGFAPPTLHSMGARVASGLSSRLFNLVITNVPGPQAPLYLQGARLLASHPVIPLAKGQALAIGLTSYDGGLFYGLNADRDAMGDLDMLGACILDALRELSEAVP